MEIIIVALGGLLFFRRPTTALGFVRQECLSNSLIGISKQFIKEFPILVATDDTEFDAAIRLSLNLTIFVHEKIQQRIQFHKKFKVQNFCLYSTTFLCKSAKKVERGK